MVAVEVKVVVALQFSSGPRSLLLSFWCWLDVVKVDVVAVVGVATLELVRTGWYFQLLKKDESFSSSLLLLLLEASILFARLSIGLSFILDVDGNEVSPSIGSSTAVVCWRWCCRLSLLLWSCFWSVWPSNANMESLLVEFESASIAVGFLWCCCSITSRTSLLLIWSWTALWLDACSNLVVFVTFR